MIHNKNILYKIWYNLYFYIKKKIWLYLKKNIYILVYIQYILKIYWIYTNIYINKNQISTKKKEIWKKKWKNYINIF